MKTKKYEYITKDILLCSAECITKCKKNSRFFTNAQQKYSDIRNILQSKSKGKYKSIYEYKFYDFSKECPAYDVEPLHVNEVKDMEIETGLNIGRTYD
jgi:hypothetical protein